MRRIKLHRPTWRYRSLGTAGNLVGKLSEEALTRKPEAARYLDARINDSNSSVSSKESIKEDTKNVGQGGRLKKRIKRLDHGNTLLGPHRIFASEADLHLESNKAEKSKPSYGEIRTENPGRKNVVNWLDSTTDSEPNVNPWQHLEIMISAKVF